MSSKWVNTSLRSRISVYAGLNVPFTQTAFAFPLRWRVVFGPGEVFQLVAHGGRGPRRNWVWSCRRFPGAGVGPASWLMFSRQACLTLYDPVNCRPPGSSVLGTSQTGILEWIAISFCRESSRPRIKPTSPALASGFFTAEPRGSRDLLQADSKTRFRAAVFSG